MLRITESQCLLFSHLVNIRDLGRITECDFYKRQNIRNITIFIKLLLPKTMMTETQEERRRW